MDELESRIRRADEAERIWNSPIMVEARAQIEAEILAKFKECGVRDVDGLATIKLMQHVHTLYDRYFKSALNDGKIARMELAKKKRLRDHLKWKR